MDGLPRAKFPRCPLFCAPAPHAPTPIVGGYDTRLGTNLVQEDTSVILTHYVLYLSFLSFHKLVSEALWERSVQPKLRFAAEATAHAITAPDRTSAIGKTDRLRRLAIANVATAAHEQKGAGLETEFRPPARGAPKALR